MNNVLVIGYGNPLRSDDGLGWHVAGRLAHDPRLAGAEMRLAEPLPPAATAEPLNIFALYEGNIGAITPLMADDLKDAEERYPPQWIEDAFREAVSLNKRSWRYIHAILKRWEAEGRDYEEAGRDPEADWLERRYARGKRGAGRLR